jgi:hypothetical protein
MPIASDISVAANGDIRYTGSGTNYTVIELHRYLGDLMDNAQASGDDVLDITSATASQRSTDNIITLNSPYNIDDTLAQHLYDGSIIQNNGDEIYDGIVNFGTAGIYLQIVQDGALVSPNFWTTGLNADAAQGISHRFMIKVRISGVDIDGRRLIGQSREYGYTYGEFSINGTTRGNNVLAISYTTDLNNGTASGTVAGWTTITDLTGGYVLLDVDTGTATEPYYSQWDKDIYTINQLYERIKYLQRRGTSDTLYGLNGELFRGITLELDISSGSGTWGTPEHELVDWGTGTGQVLAVDNKTGTSTTKVWIQRLTGVAPVATDVLTGQTSGATATVTGTPTSRTLSFPYCGVSTGSALIGAYGFGVQTTDLSASDKLTDLTGTLHTPPNNVTFTVSGLVVGEDRVLVGPESGGDINFAQLTLNTSLTGASTTVVVTASIPTDTPTTGTIRVLDDTGVYIRCTYSSYTGSTFTLSAAYSTFGGGTATAPANVWISYIDTLAASTGESFTGVYVSDRSLFIRVRDGGGTPIKTFETTGTLGSAGGSATAIRTSDA